jgi:hypothetical protein
VTVAASVTEETRTRKFVIVLYWPAVSFTGGDGDHRLAPIDPAKNRIGEISPPLADPDDRRPRTG